MDDAVVSEVVENLAVVLDTVNGLYQPFDGNPDMTRILDNVERILKSSVLLLRSA